MIKVTSFIIGSLLTGVIGFLLVIYNGHLFGLILSIILVVCGAIRIKNILSDVEYEKLCKQLAKECANEPIKEVGDCNTCLCANGKGKTISKCCFSMKSCLKFTALSIVLSGAFIIAFCAFCKFLEFISIVN